MNPQVTIRIFLAGILLGVASTFIGSIRKILIIITDALYSGVLESWVFSGVWGLILGLLMVGCYSIYISEGKWGLIRLVLILGFFIGVFLLVAFGNLGINIF